MFYSTISKIQVGKEFSKNWSQLLLESVRSEGFPYKHFIKP